MIIFSRQCRFHFRPQYQIDRRSMGGHHGHRVMVRTCNGLEVRDPSLFVETSEVESSVLFPSLDSRDELHPRYISLKYLLERYKIIRTMLHMYTKRRQLEENFAL